MYSNFKPKDLIDMPFFLAEALRSDGWYLRSDIIWHKMNPMPESVRDRPTRSHEYIFLLSRSKTYYYDADAIRVKTGNETTPENYANHQNRVPHGWAQEGKHTATEWNLEKNKPKMRRIQAKGTHGNFSPPGGRNARTVWTGNDKPDKQRGHSRRHEGFDDRWDQMTKVEQQASGANMRDVWSIAAQPFNWTQNDHLIRVESGEPCDDMRRIVSPNCPEHGGLFDLVAMVLDDEHEATRFSRTERKHGYRDAVPLDDSFPSDLLRPYCYGQHNLDSRFLDNTFFAKLRSTKIRRMAPALSTNLSCTPCAERAARIECILIRHGWFVPNLCIFANNIWPDDLGAHSPDQTLWHSDGISSSWSPSCACPIYKVATKKSSHFAVFPEKLVEPCVKAGCPKGGTVLDPFGGSMTTGVVALKLGRRFIGIELNQQYLDDFGLDRLRAAEKGLTVKEVRAGQQVLDFDGGRNEPVS